MSGRYRTIVADPPWPYDRFMPSYTPATGRVQHRPLPYPMLSLEEIAALPVRDFADLDCRLFCWTTNRYLPDSFDVVRLWGFTYTQTIVWAKTGRLMPIGGSIAPNHAEYLIVARRGVPPLLTRLSSSVVQAPKGDHSVKPEAFLDLVEQVSPGPYLELFARRQRLGWDTWGDAIDGRDIRDAIRAHTDGGAAA